MGAPDINSPVDVIDAEFISIGPVPIRERATPVSRQLSSSPVEGMAMLSRRVDRSASASTTGGPLFWISGAILALAAFWTAGGYSLLSRPAQTAITDNSGLRIASVISRVDRTGARPILMVDGKAVNESASAVAMPPLHIQIVSAAGGSTLYKLGTAGQSLASGDFFDFSSRLDLPKDGVKTVFVTFAQ